MSTPNFSTVAIQVAGQYSQIGKLVAVATRKRVRRLVGDANAQYAEFLDRRPLPLVDDAVKASLVDAQQQIAGFFEHGMVTASQRAEQAMDTLTAGIHRGVARIATAAERVESAFDTKMLSTVGTLTLPMAQLSLAVANRTVLGAERLSAFWAGDAEAAEVVAAAPVKSLAGKGVRRANARA